MFKALQPLLAERSIHILLSAGKDGRVGVYVEPVKMNDKEEDAFVTPFRCEGSPEELDAELPDVLAKWLTSRAAVTASLSEALAAAEAAAMASADEAKKKAAEKIKKVAPSIGKAVTLATKAAGKPAVTAQSVTPSLLDGCGADDAEGKDGELTAAPADTPVVAFADPATPESAPVVETAPAAPVTVAAPVVVAPAQIAATLAAAAVMTGDPVTEELF